MREIKIRAYDETSGEFAYSENEGTEDYDYYHWCFFEGKPFCYYERKNAGDIDTPPHLEPIEISGPYELFIGHKDINGKEEYVGDILKLTHKDKVKIADIRFDGLAITVGNLLAEPKDYETAEIIGNIHQNPELLSGTK